MTTVDPYADSLASYLNPTGTTLDARSELCVDWLRARRNEHVWPYWRTMSAQPINEVLIGDENGQNQRSFLNFSSQDYLALAQSDLAKEAALEAVSLFGVHSAGSPCLVGRTKPMVELESVLAAAFHKDKCVVYPTGWAAGFGVLAGLARPSDVILLDAQIHNCLAEGAKHSGSRVKRFQHNDVHDLQAKLSFIRKSDPSSGIFVVIESLYSMDSDSPDLNAVAEVCHRHEAIVILDVAHDFGAMGVAGLGHWESALPTNRPDVVMGSFSKTFASNGGFVACSHAVADYLRCYSPSWVFSNALSPVQAAIVLACLRCTQSDEGTRLRQRLMENSVQLRAEMTQRGFVVGGTPSPIVPVFVGDEGMSRRTSREMMTCGLAANLVEFPAVPLGTARFRFQLMSSHTTDQITEAARLMEESRRMATATLPTGEQTSE